MVNTGNMFYTTENVILYTTELISGFKLNSLCVLFMFVLDMIINGIKWFKQLIHLSYTLFSLVIQQNMWIAVLCNRQRVWVFSCCSCWLLQRTLCQVATASSDFQSKHKNSVVNILTSRAQKLLKLPDSCITVKKVLKHSEYHYCKTTSVY